MAQPVEITFDCLPLRSITRTDAPIDASPKFMAFYESVMAAISQHGRFNTYYLHNAQAVFRLLNHESLGMISFSFNGTVLTDESDERTKQCDLTVELASDTCEWLTQPVVDWFKVSVVNAVKCEFDRYIAAGDLEQTRQRIAAIEAQSDEAGGFMGYL